MSVGPGDWSAIKTRGFAVVRGFLSSADCAALLRDFESSELDTNRNYRLKTVGIKAFALVRKKLDAAAADIRASAGIDVDSFQGATYFATELNSLDWHQEFEPYYLCEDLYNYLNFYVPFVKDDPERSNVVVVPFDTLRARSPSAHDLLLRNGAQRFERTGNRTVVECSTDGRKTVLDIDLEALGECPPLGAGDLLIVRGDVVHRTQDTATRRIAASFRMARGSSVVHRAKLAECGPYKLRVMLRNRKTFECAFEHFAELGSDETTVAQLSKHLRTRLPTYEPSRAGLARMLAAIAPRFHYSSLFRPGPKTVVR
jgi:hypothetical protein